MEIVLLILKIIGIILLSLLLAVILLAALIMFYPVSYRLEAAYEESLCAKVKVHWLFHLISVTLDYKETGKKCILRILGIPIMDFLNPKPKKAKPQKEKKKKRKKKKAPDKERPASGKTVLEDEFVFKGTENVSNDPENGNPSDTPGNENASDIPESGNPSDTLENENVSHIPENENVSEEQKEGLWDKLHNLWIKLTGFPAKLKALIKSIVQKATNLYHKGTDLKKKVEKWVEVLKRERTRLAIGKAKLKIMGLLKHIMPRKWKAYVEYGFEDPGTTGQIYGYYWMFLGIWSERLICVPDFEHKVFKGSIFAKGHMQVIKFIYVAFQFMFDKDLVYLRKINTEVNS